MATAFLSAGALGLASCSDEWDNHYEGEGNQTAADQPSLYELVKADESLKEFVRVLDHTGYDKVLNGAQALTLWAPAITEAQADSIIALYDAQKRTIITMPDGSRRYIQDKDNKAITQFLQNHIALYGRSVSENYVDSLRMMNGKYMLLRSGDLDGVRFARKNVVARNGILYTLEGHEVFLPNVREALELDADLDSVAAFYSLFDQYSLDESSSVQRGIVNGKIVYADSVLTLSNRLYGTLGWINREDSAYAFLAPTNAVWRTELERYTPLFHYVKAIENRDSVAQLNARMAIISGRVFNLNEQKGDTLINTMYVRNTETYGFNVFPNTIFDGLTPRVSSNGLVYKDGEGRIDPKLTFMWNRYIQASSPRVFGIPMTNNAGTAVPTVAATTRTFVDTITYNGTKYDVSELKARKILRGDNFLEVTPISYGQTSNNTSKMYFYLQNTLANVYYNVYLVMVPAYLARDGYRQNEVLPMRFECFYHERLEEARPDVADQTEDANYDAPKNDQTAAHYLFVPEGETHRSGSGVTTHYFLTTGNEIDVICIDRARKPEFSSYNYFSNTHEAVMRYTVASNVRSSDLSRGNQTNIMRINSLIYLPFETEEEAKAFDINTLFNQ